MEDFKKELFKKEYKKDFPFYSKLDEKESNEVKYKLILKYELIENNFENNLRDKQTFFDSINAEDENFIFSNVLKNLNIRLNNNLYINWDNFQTIDKFYSDVFCTYFNDIWFPAVDDIDIFDNELSWIISIRHDGAIFYIKNH